MSRAFPVHAPVDYAGQQWYDLTTCKGALVMSVSAENVTLLLRRASTGDRDAENELFQLVEAELRRIAQGYMRRERPGNTIQATMLVDDAFCQLIRGQNIRWENRRQFYGFAARAMRQILVGHAREQHAQRRGGSRRVASLDGVAEPVDTRLQGQAEVLELDEALTKLAAIHPNLAEIVELHHFGGWDLKRIAEEILDISYATVKRRWDLAKTWLYRELGPAA